MSSTSPSNDAEFLEEMKRSSASDFHFFSNLGKEERERWVVGEFLGLRAVDFSVEELHSHEQQSKVDVEFRDARFQIKEIVTPGAQRSAEVEAIYWRVMAAKSLQETIGPGFSYDVPPVADTCELIREKAKELAIDRRYLEVKKTLDLLFYVTRTNASHLEQGAIDAVEFGSLGWRSISCLMGREAVVLFACKDAPYFLRQDGG